MPGLEKLHFLLARQKGGMPARIDQMALGSTIFTKFCENLDSLGRHGTGGPGAVGVNVSKLSRERFTVADQGTRCEIVRF